MSTTAEKIDAISNDELVAPIVRYAKNTQDFVDASGVAITDIGTAVNNKVRSVFGYDSARTVNDEDGFIKSLAKSPFQVTGDVLDGTIGNVVRRTTEITEPAGEIVSGIGGTVKNLIVHPLTPSKYLWESPVKAVKGVGKLVANGVIKAPVAALDEAVGGLIERPLERLKNIVDKAPIAGTILKPVTWLANGIGKGLKWLTGSARNKVNEVLQF